MRCNCSCSMSWFVAEPFRREDRKHNEKRHNHELSNHRARVAACGRRRRESAAADRHLNSLDDIVECCVAPLVEGQSYQAGPHSVALLFAKMQVDRA